MGRVFYLCENCQSVAVEHGTVGEARTKFPTLGRASFQDLSSWKRKFVSIQTYTSSCLLERLGQVNGRRTAKSRSPKYRALHDRYLKHDSVP
jgi:hypothetical protein